MIAKELKIGDKINGHERGWLTVTAIRQDKYGMKEYHVTVQENDVTYCYIEMIENMGYRYIG